MHTDVEMSTTSTNNHEGLVRFTFVGLSPVFRGWKATKLRKWQGFDPMHVGPDTHARIVEWLASDEKYATELAAAKRMRPHRNGRFTFSDGWATEIVTGA